MVWGRGWCSCYYSAFVRLLSASCMLGALSLGWDHAWSVIFSRDLSFMTSCLISDFLIHISKSFLRMFLLSFCLLSELILEWDVGGDLVLEWGRGRSMAEGAGRKRTSAYIKPSPRLCEVFLYSCQI